MKKRLLSLLLALLMLCTLAACSKSDEIPKEYGEFYTEDGILQNTHITLTIDTEELVAPVNELSYTLYEKCDFFIKPVEHLKNSYCEDLVEKYQDGAWHEVPVCGNGTWRTGLENFEIFASFGAHQTMEMSMSFLKIDSANHTTIAHYEPLEAGEYRLRVKYFVVAKDESVEIPEEQLEAVAYFTVTAPAE